MLLHLGFIYLLVGMYLFNKVLDIFSYPIIFLILPNDQARALIIYQYIQLMCVAIIDFTLDLGLLYLLFKMSTSISNRQLSDLDLQRPENPFLSLKQAYMESPSHISYSQ